MIGIRGNARALPRRNVEASLRECIQEAKGPAWQGLESSGGRRGQTGGLGLPWEGAVDVAGMLWGHGL